MIAKKGIFYFRNSMDNKKFIIINIYLLVKILETYKKNKIGAQMKAVIKKNINELRIEIIE